MSRKSEMKAARKAAYEAQGMKKAAKTASFESETLIQANEGTIYFVRKMCSIIPRTTDWDDYAITPFAHEVLNGYFQATLAQAQLEGNGEARVKALFDDLISLRDQMERASIKKFNTDADGIRYNAETPKYVRLYFGILDALIGCYMMNTAKTETIMVGKVPMTVKTFTVSRKAA